MEEQEKPDDAKEESYSEEVNKYFCYVFLSTLASELIFSYVLLQHRMT